MQAEVVEPGDLHPEGAALFAGTHTLTGDAIAGDLAETGGLGARSHNGHGLLGMHRGIQAGLVLEDVALDGGGGTAGQLQHVGELQTLLTHGVIPAVEIGHTLSTETILILGAVEMGIDLGVVALLLQDGEVVQHLCLVLGRAAQQVLEVELDEAVGIAALEEALAIQTDLGHLTHELAHAQVAALEQ